MGIYDITGWSGGGRRPINYGLKAGQFRGMGRVNVFPSNTTIVNNNIIGGGGYYSNSYDCGCNGGGGSNKFMNWMLGIGVGSTLLGGILSMFGIGGGGKAEGAGGKEEVKPEVKKEETKEPSKLDQARKTLDSLGMTKDNGYSVSVDDDGKITYHYNKDGIDVESDNITDLIDKINKAKNKDNTPTTNTNNNNNTPVENTDDNSGNTKIDYSAFKEGNLMDCIDEGGPKPINGKFSNIEKDASGKPTKFTITDNTSGTTYEFQLSGEKDGKPVYNCVSKGGKAVVGKQEYVLENGALVQKQGMEGYGAGIKTNTASSEGATPPKKDNNDNKLSNEAKQYFNKHPYTIKYIQDKKVYFSQDGKLQAYSEQQLWSMIENNQKLAKSNPASSQSAPPPSGNTQHVLTNGQKVNISGAKVGKNPKANASQKDTFYLQTSDGQKINISRMDYINIQKKIES